MPSPSRDGTDIFGNALPGARRTSSRTSSVREALKYRLHWLPADNDVQSLPLPDRVAQTHLAPLERPVIYGCE